MGIEIGAWVIGAVGSALTAVGAAGAGAAVTAFAAGAVAGTIAGAVAGAIGGAIIGAAVGGLTAAITGGDIMDGILFGAIGGAVLGGISGYFSTGAESLASGTVDTGVALDSTTNLVYGGLDASGDAIYNTVSSVSKEVASESWYGSAWSSLGDAGQSAVLGGLKDFALAGLEGGAVADAAELEAQLEREKMDLEYTLAMETLAAEKEVALASGSSGSSGTEAAENYTREVAEINAASAMDVAKQQSADITEQIAAQVAERESGYLREDEARDRARETATGVLIARQRSSKPTEEDDLGIVDDPETYVETPDTPTYVEDVA